MKNILYTIILSFLFVLISCSNSDTDSLPAAVEAKKILAEQGDVDAQYALGTMYHGGMPEVDLRKNYPEALRWFKMAATQGDKNAEYYVGYMYFTGEGVTQDYTAAASWFQRAANVERNEYMVRQAQYRLGIMHLNGFYFPKDSKKAEELLLLAKYNGSIDAEECIKKNYKDCG